MTFSNVRRSSNLSARDKHILKSSVSAQYVKMFKVKRIHNKLLGIEQIRFLQLALKEQLLK